MGKLIFMKGFCLFVGIVAIGVFLSSSQILLLFYYFREESYGSDVFTVKSHSYIRNQRPNIRRWILYGKLESNQNEVSISAADFKSVMGIDSQAKLENYFPVGSAFLVKVRSDRSFKINGRNVEIIPVNLINKFSLVNIIFRGTICFFPFMLFFWLSNRKCKRGHKGLCA